MPCNQRHSISVMNYLERELGVNARDITKLRSYYLTDESVAKKPTKDARFVMAHKAPNDAADVRTRSHRPRGLKGAKRGRRNAGLHGAWNGA